MRIAHLGHVELRVPDLAASRAFFTETMGLFVSAEEDGRIHLRAWQDFDRHTLVLTQAGEAALGRIAWRVEAPEDLDRFAAHLARLGVDVEEVPAGSEPGQGRTLRFRSPEDHLLELFYEIERWKERDPALASDVLVHPQRFVGRGVAPRRIDHVTVLGRDVEALQRWLTEALGIRLNYFTEDEGGAMSAAWMSTNPLTHQIAIIRASEPGQTLHHLAYAVDSPDEVMRAARLLVDGGTPIEWGPGIHGTSGGMFLYFREPSGHRMEVWSGAMLLLAPDWEPRRWAPEPFRALGGNLFDAAPPAGFRSWT